MKKVFLYFTLAIALAAVSVAAQGADQKTTAAIEGRIHEFVVGWNAHNPKAMASVWAEKGDLINPFGRKPGGRVAIEKLFEEEQGGPMKASTYTIESSSIREIGHGAAIADWDAVVSGMTGPDGKPLPAFQHHVTVVFVHGSGQWWADAVRGFAYLPAPATSSK